MTTLFECDECSALFTDDTAIKLYECSSCGEKFSEESGEGNGNICPSCHKFGAKLADEGCPACGESEGSAVETREVGGTMFISLDELSSLKKLEGDVYLA